MPVDAQLQPLLDQMGAAPPPDPDAPATPAPMDPAVVDQMFLAWQGEPEPVASVEDRTIPGPEGEMAIRIYTPEGSGPFPVLAFFHGGGWIMGSIISHDPLARVLCNGGGCVVVSVDYRLAPTHRFPAAAEDCYAATRWIAEHAESFNADGSRLAVGGDSAGGNLAAAVALMARDRDGPPIALQLLMYPVVDTNFDTASYRDNAEGKFLTRDSMMGMWQAYLASPEDGNNPYAAPLKAPDMSGLPSALVITAEYDPLRDEGEAYGKRLQEAGVLTTVSRYDGMVHGFMQMQGLADRPRDGHREAGTALRVAFGG